MTKGPTEDITQHLAIKGCPKRIKQKERSYEIIGLGILPRLEVI
jgi:hypothetical protein